MSGEQANLYACMLPLHILHSADTCHCQALSDFADYVQKQQKLRRIPHKDEDAADSTYGTQSIVTEDHAELDILDTLNLSDEPQQVRLKPLLLDHSGDADESISILSGIINGRLEEANGEVLFDLGLEDNGDTMAFTKEDWDFAYDRIQHVTNAIAADIKMLMTKNVGGDVEVDNLNPKEKAVSGKMMIRRRPQSVDDVIETRIAVVGNGAHTHSQSCLGQWCVRS